MKKNRIIEIVCRECLGTGEMVVEPGGDGYAPVYDKCCYCKGTGMEKTFEKNKKYFAEVR